MTKSIHGQWKESASASSSSKRGSKSMSMAPSILERLRRQQSEPTCNDALVAGSAFAVHAERWRDANSSKRIPKAGSCLRPAGPRDTTGTPPGPPVTASMELGQVHLLGHDWKLSEYGAAEKFRYHSSRVCPPSMAEVDEHMREIPGKQKWPPAQASKFYQNALAETEKPLDKPLSKSTSLEWGHPAKHHTFTGKCYPPADVEGERPERPSAWRPPEWGVPDKHRYHQPPLWAPKDSKGVSRVPPGKESAIPANWKREIPDVMAKHKSPWGPLV